MDVEIETAGKDEIGLSPLAQGAPEILVAAQHVEIVGRIAERPRFDDLEIGLATHELEKITLELALYVDIATGNPPFTFPTHHDERCRSNRLASGQVEPRPHR